MRIAVILPHTKLYGGVKRFLELGNIFVGRGHEFVVFTPDGSAPGWFDFRGRTAPFEEIPSFGGDAIFTTTVDYVPLMERSGARRRIFYHVRLKEPMKWLRDHPGVEVFACSGNVAEDDLRRHGIRAFPAPGGVNPVPLEPRREKQPGEEMVVMAYGRIAEKCKGTRFVVRACEKLRRKGANVRLLLYDTPQNDKMRRKIEKFSCKCPCDFVVGHPFERNIDLFRRADIFVSAENPRRTGWNNTVAEAMNFGIPVVCTRGGTADLLEDGVTALETVRCPRSIRKRIERLMADPELRSRLREAGHARIADFSWERLASRIEEHLSSPVPD